MNTAEREKEKVEFRYYEIPQKLPLIALLGERWETRYGGDPMHFHNYMEIGYCHYGNGTMYFGNKEEEYGDGTVTIIPRNFPHHTKGRKGGIEKWEYLFIDTERFIRETYRDKPFLAGSMLQRVHSQIIIMSKEEHPEIYKSVRSLLEEMRDKKEFYQEVVQGELLVLLLNIVRLNADVQITDVEYTSDGKLNGILQSLNYIENNYQNEIRVEHLAAVSRMSETHFRRKFSEYMNTSPAEYVNLVRIEKACEFLVKTEYRMEDISRMTGYSTSGVFIRNFKKIVGMLPREWRKAAREKGDVTTHYNISVLRGW